MATGSNRYGVCVQSFEPYFDQSVLQEGLKRLEIIQVDFGSLFFAHVHRLQFIVQLFWCTVHKNKIFCFVTAGFMKDCLEHFSWFYKPILCTMANWPLT